MIRLTHEQVERLAQPLDPAHIIDGDDGFSHLHHRYIRETLIDIFGPCGYDTTTLELCALNQYRSREPDNDEAQFYVLYRAQVRLTVKTHNGDRLATHDGAATGSAFATSYARAHDWAMKSALSNALKHAAKDLGTQFGLSLYPEQEKEQP